MDHLRYAGLSDAEQRAAFIDIVMADPLVADALNGARQLDLPDWWIVSGALYNTVWNHLTGRQSAFGVKDVDLFYFDDSDFSWDAEDAVIRRGQPVFAGLSRPVEIRNQARVHLWYEAHFGRRLAPLRSCSDSIAQFASRNHAVGIRLDAAGRPEIEAPFGLDDIFSFRVAPNRVLDNRATHEEKGRRARRNWPQVTVAPW